MADHKLDLKVLKVLKEEPVPFDEIWMRLPMDVTKEDARESLLRLQRMKQAALTYGRGWHKPAKG